MNCFTLNEYEYLGSNRSNKRGGGVGLYVSRQLDFKSRNELDKNVYDTIETKVIELNNK
jgi:hypothetical protein